MSVFNNYHKSSKDIERNGLKKLAVVVFFETIIRKFWKFVQSGALFSILSIPWMLLLYVGSYFILYMIISVIIKDMDLTQASMMTSMICATMTFLMVTLWGSGPVSAAFSFVMRSFVREEPIWIISDGKRIFKENLKQGFAVMLIDIIILAVSVTAMEMYWVLGQSMSNMLIIFQILQYILLLIIFVYTMMHPYIYQIMITFECNIKELYKNALFLTLAKLPLNFLFTLIGAAFIIVPIWLFGIYPLVVGIIVLTVGFMLTRFPLEFYALQNIKKEMLDK